VLLAHGEVNQREIGEQFGVTQQAVSAFALKYAETIAQIRDNAADEFAGLAIAQKATRLQVYEELLAAAMTASPKSTASGRVVIDPVTLTPVFEIDAGTAAKILRNVAEELGHLPTRLQLGGEVGIRTNYKIEGVTPSNLQ
jgi:hypothetical protein